VWIHAVRLECGVRLRFVDGGRDASTARERRFACSRYAQHEIEALGLERFRLEPSLTVRETRAKGPRNSGSAKKQSGREKATLFSTR
jgi:hypothetical protein